MKTLNALFFVAALFAATSSHLAARTWTDAATGRTLEGEYVSSDGTQVAIQSGKRTLKIDIARLSDDDKAFIKEQSSKPAGGTAAGGTSGGSLARLKPPASVKASPIALHNHAEKDIKEVFYGIEYLDANGDVLDKVSYGYSGGDDPILPAGKSFVVAGGNGPPEGAADAKAMVTRVTFADRSEWKASR